MNDIIAIDRAVTLFFNGGCDSLLHDGMILVATATSTWVPLGVIILYLVWRNYGWAGLLFVVPTLALIITASDQLSSSLFKPLVARYRPTNDPTYMYVFEAIEDYRGGRYGFFSSHASNTFAVAVFFGRLFRHRLTYWLLVSWALINCYTRVYLSVHYMGDVIVGTCFGIMWGYLFSWAFARWCLPHLYPATQKGHALPIPEPQLLRLDTAILLTYLAIFLVALAR